MSDRCGGYVVHRTGTIDNPQRSLSIGTLSQVEMWSDRAQQYPGAGTEKKKSSFEKFKN